MVGLRVRVLEERCYPMLIMYTAEISLRGISLRTRPGKKKEDWRQEVANVGASKRRALNEAGSCQKSWLFGN
ncbi:hypothetical protein J3F84DRAFT_355749 [Trichoderma pleuroticola]